PRHQTVIGSPTQQKPIHSAGPARPFRTHVKPSQLLRKRRLHCGSGDDELEASIAPRPTPQDSPISQGWIDLESHPSVQVIIQGFKSYREEILAEPFSPKV
ncbi:hypothetical protein EJB05_29140, partial [Eragrostis curvula]